MSFYDIFIHDWSLQYPIRRLIVDLVKSRSREISIMIIALQFDRCLDSTAAKTPATFQGDQGPVSI